MQKIICATWGYYLNRVPVTLTLDANGELLVRISHVTFGEVSGCHGIVKDLDVYYEFNGDKRHIIVQGDQGGNVRTLNILAGIVNVNNTNGNHNDGLIRC